MSKIPEIILSSICDYLDDKDNEIIVLMEEGCVVGYGFCKNSKLFNALGKDEKYICNVFGLLHSYEKEIVDDGLLEQDQADEGDIYTLQENIIQKIIDEGGLAYSYERPILIPVFYKKIAILNMGQ
jgi:hydroxymethylpyrimidine pyrophosphatase-like HAD family hydrolase